MGRSEERAGGRREIAVPVIGAALLVVGALLSVAWREASSFAGVGHTWPSFAVGVSIVGLAILLIGLGSVVWVARGLLITVLVVCNLGLFDLSSTGFEVLPASLVLWQPLLDEWPLARGDFWLFCGSVALLVSSSHDLAVRRLGGWVAQAIVAASTLFGLTFLFGSGEPVAVKASVVTTLSFCELAGLVAIARSDGGPKRWLAHAVVAVIVLIVAVCAVAFVGGEYAVVAAGAVVAALGATGFLKDRTSEPLDRQAIIEELTLLRDLAARIPDVDYIYDLQAQRYVYTNRPMASLLGVPSSDVDRVLEEHVDESDRDAFLAHVEEVNSLEDDRVLEFEFQVAGGPEKWFRNRASVFKRGGDGRPTLVFGTLQDVTERRQLIKRLRDSEERFERIADRTPGAIYQFAICADGRVAVPYISAGSKALFDIDAQAVMSSAPEVFGLAHPDDRAGLMEAIERSRAELTDFSWIGRVIRPDGEVRWILSSSRPMRHEDGSTVWDGVMIDVTEEKRAQVELRGALDRLDFLLTESPTVVYECETTSPYSFVSASSNVRRLLGHLPDQLVGLPLFSQERVHADDRSLFAAHERRFVDHGSSTAEVRLRTASGDYVWVRDEVRLVSQAERLDVIGSWTDISDQRRSMERTIESEARLVRLARRVDGMLFELVLDEESRPGFMFVGPGSLALTGLTPDEVQARPEAFFRLIDVEDRARLYRDIVRSGRDLGDLSWEGVLRDQLGRERWISVSARPFEDRIGDVVWSGVVTDRTWQRSAEAAMNAAELRLVAITNSSSQAIVSVDGARRIVGMNPVAERTFGVLSHEAVGRDLADLADSTSTTPLELVKEDAGKLLRMHGRRADGKRIALDVTVAVTGVDAELTVTGLMSAVSDLDQPARALVQPIAEVKSQPRVEQRTVLILAPVGNSIVSDDLVPSGVETVIASTAGIGLELAKRRRPDVIVLCPDLPDANLADILDAVRGDDDLAPIPVVVVDGTGQSAERIARLGVSRVSEMSGLRTVVENHLGR